jgi:hypothetical protein
MLRSEIRNCNLLDSFSCHFCLLCNDMQVCAMLLWDSDEREEKESDDETCNCTEEDRRWDSGHCLEIYKAI